ncbi:MAG TPA: type II secretion system protein GspM [Usitatibacteraceae bacterium]|nr:type II secretion system protein GspM [Usitatibacteraceae bacterium]
MSAQALKLPADPRGRRALALAILVLVVATLVAAIGVPVLMLHRHYDEAIARMTRQWQSQSAFNAQRPQLIKLLETLKAREPRKLFLKGSTAALAAAELQELVKSAIENNGGRVISVQGLANKDEGAYRVAAATFQLNVNNTNLRRVIHALESQQPYVFLDNLTIRSHTPPGYKPPPGTPEPDLFVQVDASALAVVSAEPAPATPAAGVPPTAAGNP